MDFITQTSEKLGELFQEAKILSDSGQIGEVFQPLFESKQINLDAPLLSTMPLVNIIGRVQEITKLCEAPQIETLFLKLRELILFIGGHEVHILFGALRSHERPSEFIFNPVQQSFECWFDYASGSTLFASVLKATWARCICGNVDVFQSASALGTFLKEQLYPKRSLSHFAEHFERVHFLPVFLYLHPTSSFF